MAEAIKDGPSKLHGIVVDPSKPYWLRDGRVHFTEESYEAYWRVLHLSELANDTLQAFFDPSFVHKTGNLFRNRAEWAQAYRIDAKMVLSLQAMEVQHLVCDGPLVAVKQRLLGHGFIGEEAQERVTRLFEGFETISFDTKTGKLLSWTSHGRIVEPDSDSVST